MQNSEVEETAGEMLNRLGMDGQLWAEEFHKTAIKLGYSDMDEGWLIGWFANAIMAGYDEAQRRAARAQPTGQPVDCMTSFERRFANSIFPFEKDRSGEGYKHYLTHAAFIGYQAAWQRDREEHQQNDPAKKLCEAWRYASRLFKQLAPQCEPFPSPDVLGVLTQIDNYIAGLPERESSNRQEWLDSWTPIATARRIHQAELVGYNPDVGWFNMHWRDDKGGWCYTWNQRPCNPTHWMPGLGKPDNWRRGPDNND